MKTYAEMRLERRKNNEARESGRHQEREKIEKELAEEKQKSFIEGAESMKAKAINVIATYYSQFGVDATQARAQMKEDLIQRINALNKLTP